MRKSKLKIIRGKLKKFDDQYNSDPNIAEKEEKYRKKYASLTDEDLYKPFTI